MTERTYQEAFEAHWEKVLSHNPALDSNPFLRPLVEYAWHAALEWARTQQEPVAEVVRNSAGQIHLTNCHGVSFDVSRLPSGAKLYLAPVAKAKAPEGWQIVPKEPTDCMKHAGRSAAWSNTVAYNETQHIYRAMIAAAPEYKEE